MAAPTQPRKPSSTSQRGRRATKGKPADMNQATGDEFEREGMGIAPKE